MHPAPSLGVSRARLLRLASVSIALLAMAIVLLTAHPREIWENLRGVEIATLVLVALLNLPVCALFTLRSRLVLKRMDCYVPIRMLLPVSVLGNVAGSLTPAASGEFLRAAALQRSGGMTLSAALTVVAYERLVSTYLLILSTLACVALATLSPAVAVAIIAACAALGTMPWLAATLLLPRLPGAASIEGEGLVARPLRYVLTMVEAVRGLLQDPLLLLAWSVPTLASFGLVALQIHLLARAAATHVGFVDAWTAFGGSGVAAIASLLPFGLGIGDGSMAAILQSTGVELGRAAAIVVLVRAATTLPLVLLATISYVYLNHETVADTAPPKAPGV